MKLPTDKAGQQFSFLPDYGFKKIYIKKKERKN